MKLILFLLFFTCSFKAESNNFKIEISNIEKYIDDSRNELNMKLLEFDHDQFEGSSPESKRIIGIQIYSPQSSSNKFPVIIFSGGLNENIRFYSTILSNLSSLGYVIIGIDHYYYQDSMSHSKEWDQRTLKIKQILNSLTQAQQKEYLVKNKLRAMEVFTKDIKFVLTNITTILKNYKNADANNIILIGHSIGGNADKKIVEESSSKAIKAIVALDTKFNQLNLSTNFEVPTLVIGAEKSYQKPDIMRDIPKQPYYLLKVMKHATHISFDDIAIFTVFGKDYESLKPGLNIVAKQLLENNLAQIQKGTTLRFGEDLFLGTRSQMQEFLNNMNNEIDAFIKLNIKSTTNENPNKVINY